MYRENVIRAGRHPGVTPVIEVLALWLFGCASDGNIVLYGGKNIHLSRGRIQFNVLLGSIWSMLWHCVQAVHFV